METKQNCSSQKESVAITVCEQCKISMCDQCLDDHKKLFEGHLSHDTSKNNGKTFINLCKKVNHEKKFDFFCKDHNELCCGGCVTKIKYREYGEHNDCNICSIEDIKEEKKNIFNNNVKFVKKCLDYLESIINNMKQLLEKINNNKEDLKSYNVSII